MSATNLISASRTARIRTLVTRLPFGVLRDESRFRVIWAAVTISLAGTAITSLALPLTAVITLHADAFEVGALEALEWVPWLVIGMSAGVWVDKLKRKNVLIVSSLISACLLGSIPLAHAFGVLHIWILLAVAAGVGTCSVFINSAIPALIPSIVATDHLLEANSLMRMSQSLAFTVGPALGGGLVVLIGAPSAITIDCISYLIALVILLSGRVAEPDIHQELEDKSHFSQIFTGLRLIAKNANLRPMVLVAAFGNFGNGLWSAVFILFVIRDLKISAGYLGLPLIFFGIVSMTAALGTPSLIRRAGIGRSMIVSCAVGNLPMLLIPFLTRGDALTIVLIIIPYLVAGLSAPIFNASLQSVMQVSAPNSMLGRIGSTMTMLGWGMMPLGALVGGVLAAQDGFRTALLVAAIIWNLSALGFLKSPVWSLRDLPVAKDEEVVGASDTG